MANTFTCLRYHVVFSTKHREHHRVRTSQEEYRALLDRHEIEYEERYL